MCRHTARMTGAIRTPLRLAALLPLPVAVVAMGVVLAGLVASEVVQEQRAGK